MSDPSTPRSDSSCHPTPYFGSARPSHRRHLVWACSAIADFLDVLWLYKALAPTSKLPFSSFLCCKIQPPHVSVHHQLAGVLAIHSSILLAHMITSSLRSFCPCFCSSSSTPPPSTPDLTIDLRHPPVRSFLRTPCRWQALTNVLGVLVQLVRPTEGLCTDPELSSTADAVVCHRPDCLDGENLLPGRPM
jgi:hypothetical protein